MGEETMGSPPREHKAVENGGRGRLMARQGSSSPLAAVVHVAGRNDRLPHPIREKTNQYKVLWKPVWWKRSELRRLLLQPGLQPGCKQLQQPRVQPWQLESGWSMPM